MQSKDIFVLGRMNLLLQTSVSSSIKWGQWHLLEREGRKADSTTDVKCTAPSKWWRSVVPIITFFAEDLKLSCIPLCTQSRENHLLSNQIVPDKFPEGIFLRLKGSSRMLISSEKSSLVTLIKEIPYMLPGPAVTRSSLLHCCTMICWNGPSLCFHVYSLTPPCEHKL